MHSHLMVFCGGCLFDCKRAARGTMHVNEIFNYYSGFAFFVELAYINI